MGEVLTRFPLFTKVGIATVFMGEIVIYGNNQGVWSMPLSAWLIKAILSNVVETA